MNQMHPIGISGRFLLLSAAFVILVAGMKAAQVLLVPLLLAIFLTIIIAPMLVWLQQRQISGGVSMLLVITILIILQMFLVSLLTTALTDFQQSLPGYQARFNTWEDNLQSWFLKHNIEVSPNLFSQYFNSTTIIEFTTRTIGGVGNILSEAFLILLLVIFMLQEAVHVPLKLDVILKTPERSKKHFEKVAENINRYIMLKTLISLATGFCVWLLLTLLGVDYPLLWATLSFFLNYVPNIGSLIAAVPAVVLALLQLGPVSGLYTAIGYLFINTFWGNFIEPRLMGRGLGLSTLVVLLSLLFWGWVLGPVGMLLSLPLTMTVKIVLESYPETRWIAILMDTEKAAHAALLARKAKQAENQQ
ncbi:AI-2E family transporter [Candidatus Venteria ishoeyi]|uniref:AI-2 transport protein TqsA n=1 Tax=Candidatus Venteria ishoeyi TaxID=1899563 RepID=A0A1H6FCV8_9GAMM|nr:AI-2E family transporter [Candidatus Venteria ishoeyi]MDM8546011.1 AI-2E family transporter [Candidatus Venteria ishoeyi]SEH07159.1 AI-2 transport protein TqsA [Candidatus Venteria ishoeyi]